MTDTRTPPTEPGAALLGAGRFFRRGTAAADLHSVRLTGGREADTFYRDRWSHDKVVHSTHGVNCTGSCRWKVYVKDGIITWETQETDYPTVGPDRPEYERRTGRPMAQLAAEHEGKRVDYADTEAAPVPVITSPEWSGSESGGRRYTAFTQNTEQLRPWHTLTGRQHFFLDHDWMHELGEALPVYRPPLDMHRLFGEPRLGPDGQREVTVRYLTPHNKWSIHSEYQDNLFMLSLSRGGQTIWMSPEDADAIGVRDNEWVEAVNRNGVVVARAVVSHRMPAGTVYMHHAQERTVNVPRTETTGMRGGTHNSLTRLLLKPSHLIGGYAQLSWAFNYLGPTGNQRDEVTVIRRRGQEVEY